MKRIRSPFTASRIAATALLAVMGSLSLSACKQGVQGGDLKQEFRGVQTITALSPYTVKLGWEKSSYYTSFKIYKKGVNAPIGSESFSETKITGLAAATNYEFTVTAIDNGTSAEVGFNNFRSITTFPSFTGLAPEGVIVKSASRIDLTWSMADESIVYKVYKKPDGGSWNFSVVDAEVEGKNTASVTGLTGGLKYCFFVVAHYKDSTSEPATSVVADVDAGSECATTLPSLINLPTINANTVLMGNYPWFVVNGGDPTYQIDVYNKATNQRIASRIGAGSARSFIKLDPGTYEFYAIVKNSANEQAQVQIIYEGAGAANKKSNVSAFAASGAKGPVFPPLFSGGKGIQNLGTGIATGDFNCDGLPDLAVTAENATPYIHPLHFDKVGALIIYYSKQEKGVIGPSGFEPGIPYLNTAPTPTTSALAPNPQLIYFPVSISDVRLGWKMAAGNGNGDCYRRVDGEVDLDSSDPLLNKRTKGRCDVLMESTIGDADADTIPELVHRCDDLAVSSHNGDVYVIYGDPLQGLVSGSGAANFGLDEYTCDPVSGSCRTVRFWFDQVPPLPPLYVVEPNFGKSLGWGDFNNDGYDDLAIGAEHNFNPGIRGRIWVMRGSAQGMTPTTSPKAFPVIEAGDIPAPNLTGPVFTAPEGFGDAVTGIPNSRSCVNGAKTYRTHPTSGAPYMPMPQPGYDFTKCSDLIIGVPARSSNRGSILSCQGVLNNSGGSDDQRIVSWTCNEHYPTEITGTAARYGFSLAGVANQNGYPLDATHLADGGNPNVAGALFVGAPYMTVGGVSNAGKVYGYYVTPLSSGNAQGIQYILGGPSAHPIVAQNTIACNAPNYNGSVPYTDHCYHQGLYTSPPDSGALFGYSIGTLADIKALERGLPWLAVGAPGRNVLNSAGTLTITAGGTVFLYRPDTSTLGFDNLFGNTNTFGRVRGTTQNNPACTTDCTWYSGGISPFGPSVIYPLNLNNSANFGMGGFAGGDFNGDDAGDLIAAAPNSSYSVVQGGEAYVMFSQSGSFASTSNTVDKRISVNVSKEINYRFEKAKVVGDINGDGFADVLTHLNVGRSTYMILFYGSISGLVTTPAPSANPIGLGPLLFSNSAQPTMGTRFYPVGSVNGDGFADIMLVSKDDTQLGVIGESYIFYGSFSGLVTAVPPAISPIGSAPLKFGTNGGVFPVTIKDDDIQGVGGNATSNAYDYNNLGVAHGDFNGDSFGDFAIGMDSPIGIPVDAQPIPLPNPYGNYAGGGGRVLIIYGGGNGPQTDRVTGSIKWRKSGSNSVQDIVSEKPCTVVVGQAWMSCKVQLLASVDPGPSLQYGWDLEAVPSLEVASGEMYDELLFSDTGYNGGVGRVYFYKGTATGLSPVPLQTIDPHPAYAPGGTFGYNIAVAGDINKDGAPDVMVTAPCLPITYPPNSPPACTGYLYAFYSGSVEGKAAFFGSATNALADTNLFGVAITPNNLQQDFSGTVLPYPQIAQPPGIAFDEFYAFGVVGLGDVNSDGYADVAVNVAIGDYNIDAFQDQTGYAVIYFGGPRGLRINGPVTSTPRCHGGIAPVCDPFQLFLPVREAYERTYLSESSVGDINGDGKPDLIMGAFGRTHPSGNAFATGVIYVLY